MLRCIKLRIFHIFLRIYWIVLNSEYFLADILALENSGYLENCLRRINIELIVADFVDFLG